MKNNDNYKFIIGFIIGALFFGGVGYAALLYDGKDIYYSRVNSTLNSTNVQDAIDELADKLENIPCAPNMICIPNS